MIYECFCRDAQISDDIEKIARYIHLTDPYIYPVICKNPSDRDWQRFIAQCYDSENNLYSRENISVAVIGGDIVGAACIIPCGKRLELVSGICVPGSLAGGIARTVEGYFGPLLEESGEMTGYNLVNICVDEAYRGRGIGGLLLEYCINKYGERDIILDVVSSNSAAIKMYEKYGFVAEKEYLGYSGNGLDLPCLRMVRRAASLNDR